LFQFDKLLVNYGLVALAQLFGFHELVGAFVDLILRIVYE